MRKVLALLLTAVMLLSLCCGVAGAESTVKDGTYEETVYGNNFTIPFKVAVTFENNAITAIEVTDRGGEWAEYDDSILQSAIDTFIPRIIEAQSIAVDATTGATLSSAGIRNAVRMAIEEAGGDVKDFQMKPEKSTETVVIEGYDVVVVGLGASGVMAYCNAADAGAKVFGIDAAARIGGTSTQTSGPMAVNPASESVQSGETVDAEAFKALWKEDTAGGAKDELIDLIVDKSGEALDYAINELGYSFYPTMPFSYPDLAVWATYNCEERSIHDMMVNAIESRKALNDKNDYMLELKGQEILKDENGAVAGVKAVAYDGTTYEIYAPSVILCTGGFGGNREMTTEAYGYPIRLHGMYQNDGTMIKAALDGFNAGTYSMSSAGMCHSGRTANLVRIEGVTPGHNKALSAIANNYDILAVNENGVRFANEAGSMTVAENYWRGGTQYYYAIVDQAYMDNLKENGFDSVYMMINSQDFSNSMWYPFISENYEYALLENDPITDMDTLIEGSIAAKNLYKASTVAELAELIGASELSASVEAYNASCESGEDTEFGKDAEFLKKIDEASGAVYAIKAAPYCYSTNGALDVNVNIEVLDADGNVIPGLYACGTDSMGVFFTEETGYIDYGGVAHGWCFTSGKIAGENAAAYGMQMNEKAEAA